MKDRIDNNSNLSIPGLGIYGRYMKRPMDIILSLISIIFLIPLLLIIAILVKKNLGDPILFKQDRLGMDGKIFTIYKFRSMTDKKDKDGRLSPDHIRLTSFGKFLRSTSIDELPQLFNILKGDMSIVGPRPYMVEDVIFMDLLQRRRHDVLPGLTGAAQVRGRNCIGWEERLQLDLDYIDNISFINDWKIMFKTVLIVIRRDHIAPKGMVTGESLGDYLVRKGTISEEEKDHIINNIDKTSMRKGLF